MLFSRFYPTYNTNFLRVLTVSQRATDAEILPRDCLGQILLEDSVQGIPPEITAYSASGNSLAAFWRTFFFLGFLESLLQFERSCTALDRYTEHVYMHTNI